MEQHGQTHHIPASVYYKNFVVLLVLMILTVAAAQINLGWLNIPIALAIAVTKATLVVLFFMGVKYGTRLTWVWVVLGFIWLIIMFGITLDYVARGWVDLPQWRGKYLN